MSPMQTQIPPTLAQFFQEYTFERLDAEQHAELVIERTLAWGNREELRWLFARYGRDRVAEWVRRKGWGYLPKRRTKYPYARDFELQAVESLTFFENAESDIQPNLLIPIEWDAVKRFFVEQAKTLRQKWFGF